MTLPKPTNEALENASRALLAGVLAVQADMISKRQLFEALQRWMQRKSQALGDILVDTSVLSEEREALLAALIQQHLQQHGGNLSTSLSALSIIASLRDELSQIEDEDLQATLSCITASTEDEFQEAATIPPTEGCSPVAGVPWGTRFRVLRPHAKGGLGEVFVAEDTELNRKVALKEIQARFADDADSRARFLIEAEITEALEHPGVVPVYGLGQYADGRPYYAMRFVHGESLHAAINAFHQLPANDAAQRSPELRKLLGRMVDVCNAIAYAHSRGVLHRDLKPDNILLGQFGETLVVDWGLAKRAVNEPHADDDVRSVKWNSGSKPAASATRVGAAIGTPAFMSPEQAAGKVDQLGPATDIYCLGATLYMVLTGCPPHKGKNLDELFQNVIQGEFARPSSISPTVARPLEAICLRAMSLEPRDRYSTATELAEDIERWLADEPVSAYRDSMGERVGRWARRHRSWTRASAAALVAIAVVSIIALFFVNDARQQESLAREKAETLSGQREQALLTIKTEKARADAERDEAKRQAKLARLGTYNLQTLRIGDIWREEPGRALAYLNDESACPAEFRDFTWRYFYRLSQRVERTLRGHDEWITAVEYSGDGRWLASSSEDKTIRLWNAETGEVRLTLLGHEKTVRSVTFSPDGEMVASAGADGTIRMWSVETGEQLAVLTGHDGSVASVSFSPDGASLATAGSDRTVRLWSVAGQRELAVLGRHDDSAHVAKFSPNGKLVASGGDDARIRVWDVEARKERFMFGPVGGWVRSVAFSADGETLATASVNARIDLWNLESGELRRTLTGQKGLVVSIALSPDGTRLASASQNGWEMADDGGIVLWSVEDAAMLETLRGPINKVHTVAFSPSGKRLAAGGFDDTIKFLKVDKPLEYRVLSGHQDYVASIAFSPDGRTLASASADKTVRLWGVESGKEQAVLVGHTDVVKSVAFAPDGNTLASAGSDHTIRLWNGQSREQTAVLRGHEYWINCVAFGWDGKTLASASGDRTVTLWNAVTGQPVSVLTHHTREVTSVAYSRPHNLLITAGTPNADVEDKIQLLDAKSGKRLAILEGHTEAVRQIAVSPDGNTLATASEDMTVKLWDLKTRSLRATLSGHTASVRCVCFSPDGRTLASGGRDETVRLWDPLTGQLRATLAGHQGSVSSVAFSPDGTFLATAGLDDIVRLWEASPPSKE